MVLKTDSTHKNFSPKSVLSSKIKPIAIRLGTAITTLGLVMTMSGCSNASNKKIKNEMQVDNTYVMELYNNGNLSEYSELESLDLTFNAIDEDFIKNLPSSIQSLTLRFNPFITDLSMLPEICPNIEELYIEDCFSITDYNFIKELKNLKKLNISETIGINQDILNYLNKSNINHNIDESYVKIDQAINEISNSIITENMTEEEKIQQIVLYVMQNIEYDSSESEKYNKNPLKYALEGKGVCINYSALTNALCRKSGIYSVVATNDNHGWNLVEIEEKYYYIDVTNINQIPIISKLLLENVNLGFFYKQDPYATSLSAMSDVDKLYTDAPQRVLELIKEANNKKSFIEKYGSNLYIDIIVIVGVLAGLGLIKKTIKKRKY